MTPLAMTDATILTASLNDVIQWSGVIIALGIAIVWIIRRIIRGSGSGCDCGCSGCALYDKCQSPKKDGKDD